MDISNIDELLGSKQPVKSEVAENEPEGEYETKSEELHSEISEPETAQESSSNSAMEEISIDEAQDIESANLDDYGNKKTSENEVIRDRLKKQAESLERKHKAELDALRSQLADSGASREVQQAAKDFEYDPNDSGDWQQRLAYFVKQTVNNMSREEGQRQQQAREHEAQREFETKFRDGMYIFDDFV